MFQDDACGPWAGAGRNSRHGRKLDAGPSRLAFGSIKSNDIGEVHEFKSIDGTASADGTVTLGIDLASVETYIDIRNERMIEHLFKNVSRATISAQIDMDAMQSTPVGEGTVIYAEGVLDLLGAEVPVDADLYVLRLSGDKVMVTTDSMIFLSTADAETDEGVDTLKSLAELPSIARAVPVTMRLMFEVDDTSG